MPINNPDISKQDKTRLKRIKLRIKHLLEELEQAEDLKAEYDQQFQQMITKLQVSLGLKKDSEKSKEEPSDVTAKSSDNPGSFSCDPPKPSPQQPSISDEDIRHEADNHSSSAPTWMKKLYKQIAIKTHPDKIEHLNLSPYERSQYNNAFNMAKSAIQEAKGGDLVYAAESIGIEPDIPITMRLSLLVSRGEKIKEKIQSIYKTPSWVWGESYAKRDLRKKILISYCNVYKHNLPSEDFFDKFLDELEAK